MRHILKRLRFHLARIRSQGLLKSSEYALFTALGERWGIEIQAAYAIPRGSPPAQDPSLGLSLIRSLQDLSVEDQSALTEYAGQDALHAWLRAFAAGRDLPPEDSSSLNGRIPGASTLEGTCGAAGSRKSRSSGS